MTGEWFQAVGVDIVEVARVRAILDRHHTRFLARVFTAQEVADCAGRPASLAARWAGKEAVSKALGCGWEGLRWTDIEIVRLPGGRPGVVLYGQAQVMAAQLGLTQWAISLSHADAYAVAFVMASGTRPGGDRD